MDTLFRNQSSLQHRPPLSEMEPAREEKAREATHHMEQVNRSRGSEQRLYLGNAWKPPSETEGSGEIWLATYAPSGVERD